MCSSKLRVRASRAHRTKKKQSRSSKNQSNRNLVQPPLLLCVRACVYVRLMTVLQRTDHFDHSGAPNMALPITDLGTLEADSRHSTRSLDPTYYPTQLWRLLHSFAIRHVCNFFYYSHSHHPHSLGTTFSSSPLRCMRFTLFTRLPPLFLDGLPFKLLPLIDIESGTVLRKFVDP